MRPKQSDLTIDFTNMSGGLNTKDPHIAIGDNQVYSGSENAVFKRAGFAPWFGFQGIKSTSVFSGKCRGMDIYSRVDGTDQLIGIENGNIYSVNKLTGEITLVYALGGSGECWFLSYYDKLFAANGTASCVIEGSSGYPIGITPPSGVSAAASAGGSLDDGDYEVYVSYARSVAGANVLYSQGEYLGTVTLGSGNSTVSISNFSNSSDSRVGNKVVWMTDADGSDVILYHQTNDNTTEAFSISDTSGRNSVAYYRILSNSSAQPPVMTGIFPHNDRIYGWRNNVLYASMQAVTVYDLERWPGIQYEFPFQISGLFAIGEDLYINSINRGVYRLPNGDMAAAYEQVSKKMCFKYPRTVQNTDENTEDSPSPVIGVTNNGVRIFDGKSFSIDLSKSIKNDMEDLYDGANSDFQPCAIICRANDRTEYRLSYRDLDIGSNSNNYTYVLNLDELTIISAVEYIAPWEGVKIGFSYACIDSEDTVFMAQSLDGNSQVFKENKLSTIDKDIFNNSGEFISNTQKEVNVVTKMVIPSIGGRIRLEQLRYISYMRSEATIQVVIGEDIDINESNTVDTGPRPVFGVARFGVDRFATTEPIIGLEKLGMDIKGVAVYIVINYNSGSIRDYLSEIKLFGEYEEGTFK